MVAEQGEGIGHGSVFEGVPVRGFSAKTQKGSRIQEPGTRVGEVNVTFKEPVHKILEQIKNEPYFRWLRKMGGDPSKRNQICIAFIVGTKGIPPRNVGF